MNWSNMSLAEKSAIVVVGILIVVAGFMYISPSTPVADIKDTPDNDAKSTPTYVEAGVGLWDSQSSGAYTCKGSLSKNYCAVALSNAQAMCTKDPKCLGYVKRDGKDIAQLISAPPVQMNYASTYYKKT